MALHAYLTVPFNRIKETNPVIKNLVAQLGTGRSASAMKTKAYNFASLDDSIPQRGLTNAAKGCREIWQEFLADRAKIFQEIDDILVGRSAMTVFQALAAESAPASLPGRAGATVTTVSKRRLGQGYFRRTVMSSYDERCGVTGLAVPRLVEASHIVPWREADEKQRLDATNGIALNALLHRAFDAGYVTFDEKWRLQVSGSVKQSVDAKEVLLKWDGADLRMPGKFGPCKDAMAWHRTHVFDGGGGARGAPS